MKGLDNIYKVKEFIEREKMQVSVRQAYYYLLTQGVIKESESSYKTLDGHLVWARKEGIIHWNCMDDGSRETYRIEVSDNIEDYLKGKIKDYNRDFFRPDTQNNFILIFLEKDALKTPVWNAIGVLQIPIVVSRGYMSWGYFYHEIVSKLFMNYPPGIFNWIVLVLSDWDNEGEDMVNLLREMFDFFQIPIGHFEKIGLIKEQLEDKETYPNLRKLTLHLKKSENGSISEKSKAKYRKWIKEHGMVYSELDCFTPTQLTNLVRNNVRKFIDIDNVVLEHEKEKQEKAEAFEQLGFKIEDEESESDVEEE